MKLSSKAHYGLNACCVLAGMYPEKASARELEEALGVSGKYLEQMMRLLASRGIVRAQRGAAGAPAKNACPQPSGRSSTGRSTGCWTK